MNYEIVQRGKKFFLIDPETQEVVGDTKGYKDQKAAKTAMQTLSQSKMMAKMPMPGPQPAPTEALTGNAARGLGAVMANIREKGRTV